MAAYQSPEAGEDDVFRALADATRRRLLDSLNIRNGQTLGELCAGLDMARQSVSKHLDILEAANLVTTLRRGREKLHFLNPAPISEIGERWIRRYDLDRVEALTDLKRALEEPPMESPSFVYTTYIQTSPERLWHALTEPEFTHRYWGATLESDWKAGSPITFTFRGERVVDPEQVILESDPYRRLSYTWHTMTNGLATKIGLTDEQRTHIQAEKRSKVVFDIEDLGAAVKLSIVHDGFDPGSVMATMVTKGWPQVLSGLKTLLETGDTLPDVMENRVAERLGLTS
jgi:uncharacterized protein YndB with AHSA1/START domain/DNA-binding transcriptional ArsR family regulator